MNWEDKINTVWQGDCLELMKEMPDKCIDLVVTDPPYGIKYKYDIYEDTEENLSRLIASAVPEIRRVAKIVAIFTGVQNVWKYPQADWIIGYVWNTTGSFGLYGYNQWQPIILYGKDVKGFGSVNGQIKSDVIRFSGMASAGYSKEKSHPCPKPENIIKKLVARLSFPGEIVFDPFMGSWTTARACVDLGRNFVGAELSAEYCEIGRQRLRQQVLL